DGLDAQKKQLADTANSIGLGADAIKSGLLDAVRNAKDANEAGTAFADTVITGIENAMYDNAAKQITDIITQGLVNPIVNAVIAGTSVTDAVSSAAIDDMVKKAGLVAQAVGDLLNNPDFKAALDKIHSSMASIGTSFYGARPPSTAKPQDKGGDKPGDTAANDAKSYADYMLQLNRQLADLKAPDDYTKQLSAIINQYEDGKQKLADMHKAGDAAAMSLLNQTKAAQLLALQTQMTADAFNRAINQLQAMQKLAGAQGNNSSALALGAAVAKSTYDNAVSKAAASLGFTDASLAAWLKATNQTLEQAAQSYWGGMSAAQKEAATAAINAKADLIAANRAVYDAQLKIVTDLAAAIDSLQSVSNKVADDIAKVQIDQGKLTESAWLDSQIAASKQHLAKLYGNGADTAELVAEANNLEALTMQRYEAEKTAIGNLTAYAKQLGDYAKSLLTGNLSPLNAVEKLKRAEADYAETLAAANKGDKDAQGKLTQRADVFLNLARDYYASSQGYTDVFNRIQRDMTGAGASTLSNAEQQAQYLSQLAGNATKTLAELSNIKDAAGYLKTNLTSQLQGAQTTLTTMASSLTSLGVTLPELLRGLPSAIAAAMSGAMAPKVVYATQDGGTAASKAPAFPKPIPGFASGGDHAGGIAQVGEHGPELIATGAARVFTAQQTRQILAGPAIDWRQYGRQDNSALVAEVRRLRETNEKLEQRLEAIEQHTADANHQRGEIAVQQLDRLDNTNKTLGQLQTATELA
ncbi:hypothetical protein, partial [Chitinimonas sp.]|uniref:hypothetical protein n=1 Tax=Chitinimonas sp. TaxID=1934313 RepID=UPI0035AEE655